MAFAIFRVSKHKEDGTIRAASSHMMRTRETANADPSRLDQNRVLVGDEDSDPADLVASRFEEATTGQGKAPRKNGVRALEVFMGASPEWFAKASEQEREAWQQKSTDWLTGTFGGDNVVSLVLHQDERTPHLTGFIVPVDPATGRMNAARWTDGKVKMEALQTGYAQAVKDLGLVRGIAGSTATHQAVREFYGAIAHDVGGVEVPPVGLPPRLPTAREEWAEKETKRIGEAIAPAVQGLAMQARAGLVSAARVKSLQADNAGMRDVADQVRAMPLQQVIDQLGLRPDKTDKTQYRDDQGLFRITITPDGRKFYDHTAGKGGGGAIDLAKHVLGVDYKGAVSWLAGSSGTQQAAREVASKAVDESAAIVADAQSTRPVFQLPTTAPDRALIERYLTRERGLDAGLVNHLVDAGQITSDARANIAFVMTDAAGEPRGLELRGTDPSRPFRGLAPGSSRDATFRVLADPGRSGKPPRVMITESAIDTLSVIRLLGDDGEGPWLVASTSGARPTLPSSLTEAAKAAPVIVAAYDNDQAGEAASAKLLAALGTWFKSTLKRFRPRRKDWNEDLLHHQREKAKGTPTAQVTRDTGSRRQDGPGMG